MNIQYYSLQVGVFLGCHLCLSVRFRFDILLIAHEREEILHAIRQINKTNRKKKKREKISQRIFLQKNKPHTRVINEYSSYWF